ncbi:MAG: hypothetical protein AVDCRST_MAG77-4985 [uncultured Chloroflexi bacterium]|uniref:Glycosyltransferase RgtA/B/C/D-like domain-containing protein n=1 Tax=uncultured Chloroflexota bacterium TaxID=166587 RepID=A0A6J4K297_9CHLR|nr:MAG: hypothetical protein AVDCRST_MAG77-4985 [uncultured Chloroflexota bacterium]
MDLTAAASGARASGRLPLTVQVLAWLLSFAVYGAYYQGQWVYGEQPIFNITGDEPHYLTIAVSMVRDGDLDVLNNYRDKEYTAFYPSHLGDTRDAEDMHALYGRGGGLYSKHGFGLPLLLAPAMRLGGHGAGIVLMLAVTALASVLTLRLALACSNRRWPAVLAWLAVAFSPPLLLYAPLFYPEVAGAACSVVLAHALLVAWRERRLRTGIALAAGVALGVLPWLHLRYLPIAGMFAAGLALAWWRSGRNGTAAATLFGVPAAAGVALLALDWRLFGGVPAVGEYGAVGLAQALTGAPGLLLDRQFGLLPYGPVYLLGLGGIALLPRAIGKAPAALLLLPVVAYAGFIACFSYWYGAFSPPARMLVPVAPLLVAPLVAGLAAAPHWAWLYAMLCTLTAAQARLLLDVPRLRYNQADGQSAVLEHLSATWGRDVTGWLPSFVAPTAGSYVWTAVASLVAAGLLVALARIDLTPNPSPARRGGVRLPATWRPSWVIALRSRLLGVR